MEYKKDDIRVLDYCRKLDRAEIQKLPFKKLVFSGIENSWLIEQHFAQKAATSKLPDWSQNPALIYPDKISVEQSSSSWIAKWKASLVPKETKLLIDGTAGLGVDCFYLGQRSDRVLAYEIDPLRANLLNHNLALLGLKNFEVLQLGFEEVIGSKSFKNSQKTLVYLDPDRRPDAQQKVNSWENSRPDLLLMYNILKQKHCKFLVKLSPMDNPFEVAAKMQGLSGIYIVSLHLEVKEVLLFWDFANLQIHPKYSIVEIQRSGQYVKIDVSDFQVENQKLGHPAQGQFLYDPWPALRKGFVAKHWFKSNVFSLLSPDAQLFIANENFENVPARVFQIKEVIGNFSEFAKKWKGKSLNVISRNFFASAEEIKKRNRFSDGGESFLFCYQNIEKENIYLLTEKQSSSYSESFWQKISE